MGFNFRKSFKIAPGVRLNVGKNGISSVSVGGKGGRVSVGKKGVRSTVSAPGTGLSYSTHQPFKSAKTKVTEEQQTEDFSSEITPPINQANGRQVSLLLGVGILFMPYIFTWFTLREGHSTVSRVVSFLWLIFFIILIK